MATIAGAYFGLLFEVTQNLAVPIVAHFAVDFVAFLFCHWRVAYKLSPKEQLELFQTDLPIANEEEWLGVVHVIVLKRGHRRDLRCRGSRHCSGPPAIRDHRAARRGVAR